jgi:hypothetical protein
MTAIGLRRLALPSLALSVLLAGPAPAAGTRSRLLDDDYEVFAQEAQADDEGPATRRQDDRRRANDGDWFRAPAQQGPEDFPADELRDAVEANARAATARAMFRRAESSLHATVRDAQREFDESKELRDALAAEKKAYDALQDARREALQFVVDDPKYQAMLDLREGLSRQIAERREGVTPAPAGTRLVATTELVPAPPVRGDEDVVAIATVKLRVGRDARAMEREALEGNDKIRQARADLAAAGAKVSELRQNFDRSLRANDDLKQAREELEDARIARLTAETYNKGAREAAREALDFTYYLHRYDYYRYPRYGLGYSDTYGYRYGYPYYGVNYMGRRR